MRSPLRIALFAHSLVSDWNHGNAHFLRGLALALMRMGHRVKCYEELGSWSLANLVQQEPARAEAAVEQFRRAFPELDIQFYQRDSSFADAMARELRNVDVVIIHEWNEPVVVNQILALKLKLGFRALFHDTHHRAYTRPGEILRFDVHLFDGVLAFGEAVRRIYSDGFGIAKTWTFHEAADVEHFSPVIREQTADVLWIGNWGDEERSRELEEFLIAPAMPDRRVVVYGVRYPACAMQMLNRAGIHFGGYLPNLEAPRAYAESGVALHVPRRQYANGLSGVPTIRVFEALACGATLVCAPWSDEEKLFRAGEDFLVVPNGAALRAETEWLLHDERARRQIGANGLQTVHMRHTCMHRAQQFTEICEEILT